MIKRFVVVMVLFVLFLSVQGCNTVADLKDIKTMTVGKSNVKTQEAVRKSSTYKAYKVKKKKGEFDRGVWTTEVDYGSLSKEERLSYSPKTDKQYFRLFAYRLYYDYSKPDEVLILIRTRVDISYGFNSVVDQSGKTFELIADYPNLMNLDAVTYNELYTITLPMTYLKKNQDKGIVLDLLSDKVDGTLFGKKENLSRTFHIAPFFIKGFFEAIADHQELKK